MEEQIKKIIERYKKENTIYIFTFEDDDEANKGFIEVDDEIIKLFQTNNYDPKNYICKCERAFESPPGLDTWSIGVTWIDQNGLHLVVDTIEVE